MEHARAYGFPVPQVLEVLEDALVLEGIDGPTMRADLRRRGHGGRRARHLRSLSSTRVSTGSPSRTNSSSTSTCTRTTSSSRTGVPS